MSEALIEVEVGPALASQEKALLALGQAIVEALPYVQSVRIEEVKKVPDCLRLEVRGLHENLTLPWGVQRLVSAEMVRRAVSLASIVDSLRRDVERLVAGAVQTDYPREGVRRVTMMLSGGGGVSFYYVDWALAGEDFLVEIPVGARVEKLTWGWEEAAKRDNLSEVRVPYLPEDEVPRWLGERGADPETQLQIQYAVFHREGVRDTREYYVLGEAMPRQGATWWHWRRVR
jgi:hypothetical protein